VLLCSRCYEKIVTRGQKAVAIKLLIISIKKIMETISMYNFVPAAIDSFKKTGFGLYIKYTRSNSPDSIVVKKNAPNYMWLVCPDRELVLIEHGSHPEFVPMGENFDKYVDFNLYDDHVCAGLDVDSYMINYSQYGFDKTGKMNSKSPMFRRNGRNPNMPNQPKVIADSGGFQLYTGKKDYLDPKEVIEWYNENIDWGMVLDVPPIVRTDHYLKRSAMIQGENNRIMMDHKNEHVELINIAHGDTYEKRMEFLKHVDHPGINRLATTGYRDSVVSTIAELLQLILRSERKFKHYHVLGVYNLRKLLPIIKVGSILPEVKIGKWKGVPLITSDASTPLQSAVNKLYHHQQSVYEPARRLVIGARNTYANVHAKLPCACPVCSNIQYLNILGILDKQVVSNLIGVHNLYEIRRYSRMMDELAHKVSNAEYKAVVRRQLGSRAKDTLAALDLISVYMENPEETVKQYQVLFKSQAPMTIGDTYLMNDDDSREILEKASTTRQSTVAETDSQRKARYEATLHGYEKIYGITPDPEVLIIKKKKKKKKTPLEQLKESKKQKRKKEK
jgi:predicted Fe-Mo cluster-binding NifX family protein